MGFIGVYVCIGVVIFGDFEYSGLVIVFFGGLVQYCVNFDEFNFCDFNDVVGMNS